VLDNALVGHQTADCLLALERRVVDARTVTDDRGDFAVWGGLAPDFVQPEARQAFGDFHDREHVALGISGYKLDECDNSYFTGSWSFPELSKFPSGADGEQMHSMFGQRYADAIQIPFDRHKTRTYGLIRSEGALAAPYPYALYSDLYDHAEFVKGVAKIGFCGLLWTPEVRDAETDVELIRRLQSVVLSPLALINAWYIKNPPWMQIHADANNAGQLDPNWERIEAQCRTVMELRMKLVPYLHAAYVLGFKTVPLDRKIAAPPTSMDRLRFRWRVFRFPVNADETVVGRMDNAASVYVLFHEGVRDYVIKYLFSAVHAKGFNFRETDNAFKKMHVVVLEDRRETGVPQRLAAGQALSPIAGLTLADQDQGQVGERG